MDTISKRGSFKPKPEDPGQHNLCSLVFVINGDEELVEKVNINQPLRVAAQKALDESGNSSKPLSDYQVVYNEQQISLDKKVGDYNFPANALIYLNLNTAGGGTERRTIC